jgi:hypothetical protein
MNKFPNAITLSLTHCATEGLVFSFTIMHTTHILSGGLSTYTSFCLDSPSKDIYMFLFLGYCEQCCNEHGSADVSSHTDFTFFRYILYIEIADHMVALFLIF